MALDPNKLNKICDRIDTLKKKLAVKQSIIDEIQKLKAQCNGAPTFTVDASLPSLNINFAIFYFLRDIISILGDLNINEIRTRIVNWLVSIIEPLQKRIADLLKFRLKSCFICKVEPNIGEWLFLNNPSTGQIGTGWNIRVEDIDDRCLFKINPNSDYGKLKYDNGFNRFLWDVIQQSPATLPWVNPNNGRTIAHFTFLENNTNAFTKGGINQPQTTSPETNVINMKIDNYYETKTLTDFIIEYLDSIMPLFDIERLIPQSMDSTFGTISKQLKNKKGDRCLEKEAEVDALLDQLIEFGIDDEEVVVDDSFFEFDEKAVINIKETVRNRKKGQMVFTDCCNKKSASISPQTLIDLNNKLTDPNINDGKKVEVIQSTMGSIIEQTSKNVSPQDVDKAGFEFLLRLIANIMRDLWNLTNSPKNKIINQFLIYLTQGSISPTIREYFKISLCVQRQVLGELMKKLIYELFIPWILQNLRPLILCVLGKILTEKKQNYDLSLKSLIPGLGLTEDVINQINGILGKASTISNNLNLGPVKASLGLKGEGLGKFC